MTMCGEGERGGGGGRGEGARPLGGDDALMVPHPVRRPWLCFLFRGWAGADGGHPLPPIAVLGSHPLGGGASS